MAKDDKERGHLKVLSSRQVTRRGADYLLALSRLRVKCLTKQTSFVRANSRNAFKGAF